MRAGVLRFSTLLLAVSACAGTGNSPRSGDSSLAAQAASALRVPSGFEIEAIAQLSAPRQLAALPNGDLIVGTQGSDVYLVPAAEGRAGAPHVFARLDDKQAAGVTYSPQRDEIYVATTHHVWAIAYHGQAQAGGIQRIADVRTGPVAPGTDGDVHTSTSVAFTGGRVYAAAGSSCNATMDDGKKPCTEVDPTRAAVSVMGPQGEGFAQRAKRIRNAIALAVNPQTGSLWVGGAGQDDLPVGHPYEYLDDLSAHAGDADYGWPECEENHHVYWAGYDCSKTVEPSIELPAYSTIIGATFYPLHQSGSYAFPPRYRGGLFAAVHGSWHTTAEGCYAQPPRVVFVAMNGDRPVKPVDWKNPTAQWIDFVTGFQSGCHDRTGRATGIAVGPKGSLFIADDQSGTIYRLRPTR
jgi:glucose/arabinose dehydrogenase